MQALPGLRDLVYLDGVNISTPPSAIKPIRSYAETHERLADTSLATDRPVPFTGAEVRTRKFGWSLAWSSIAEADIEKFEDLDANPGPLDLCVWRPITERFVMDSVATDCVLARRLAIVTIAAGLRPVGYATTYATEVTLNGTAKAVTTDYTWGGVSTLGHQILVWNTAPAGNAIVLVRYAPVFLVTHTGTDLSFDQHREPRAVMFEEAA